MNYLYLHNFLERRGLIFKGGEVWYRLCLSLGFIGFVFGICRFRFPDFCVPSVRTRSSSSRTTTTPPCCVCSSATSHSLLACPALRLLCVLCLHHIYCIYILFHIIIITIIKYSSSIDYSYLPIRLGYRTVNLLTLIVLVFLLLISFNFLIIPQPVLGNLSTI